MQWPIDAAKASGLFDAIVVSTDDDEIAEIAHRLGCALHWREKDDGSKGTQEIAKDVLMQWRHAKEACVIYPCSPFLEPETLKAAVVELDYWRALYVVSTYPDRIQDCGCFYVGKSLAFIEQIPLASGGTRLYPLPPNRCIDINTESDWQQAEEMFDDLRAEEGDFDPFLWGSEFVDGLSRQGEKE